MSEIDDVVREHYESESLPTDVLTELVAMKPSVMVKRRRWPYAAAALAATALIGVGVASSSVLLMTGAQPMVVTQVSVDATPAYRGRAVVDTGSEQKRISVVDWRRRNRDEDGDDYPSRISGNSSASEEGEMPPANPFGLVDEEDIALLSQLGYFSSGGGDGVAAVTPNQHRNGRYWVDGRYVNGVVSTTPPPPVFLRTAARPFSTFAADVDNASWVQARELIEQGGRPDRSTVRIEEFINAMPYNYPEPDGDFGVTTELVAHSVRDVQLVRIGVQGRHIDAADRPPLNLTFLVDVSGSMSASDKLPLVVSSLQALTAELGPEDSVALVTYASRSEVLLPATRVNALGKIQITAAIGRLGAGGSTAMGDGIGLAYGEAARHHRPGAVSRVIVASDGDANVGTSNGADLATMIRHHADEGIALTTLGVGAGRGKDETMEMLSNKGDGQYFFLGNADDAERLLVDRLTTTMVPLARDVKLQVEWDAEVVTEYRLLGYDNRRLADADFRRDPVDAGEVGAGHQVTALYAVKLAPDAGNQALGVLRLRAKPPGSDAPAVETAFVLSGPVAADPVQASVDTTVAMAAASLAGHLVGEELLPLSRVEALLARVVDSDVPEHVELLQTIRWLLGGRGTLDGADAGSGVVSVKVKNVGFNVLEVVCGGFRERAAFRGGRAVVSSVPQADCTATARGDENVTFSVVPGASYLCDEGGCRQVL